MTKLAYSFREAAEASGLSKSFLDNEVRAGRLRVKRTKKNEHGDVSGNRVILVADLEAYLASLPEG